MMNMNAEETATKIIKNSGCKNLEDLQNQCIMSEEFRDRLSHLLIEFQRECITICDRLTEERGIDTTEDVAGVIEEVDVFRDEVYDLIGLTNFGESVAVSVLRVLPEDSTEYLVDCIRPERLNQKWK